MSEFKIRLGWGLGIRVLVVRIFEPFWVQTTGFGHRTTKFMCNFGLNFLENFIKINSDNQIRTLKNRAQIRSHKISVKISTNQILNSGIRTTGSGHSLQNEINFLTENCDRFVT